MKASIVVGLGFGDEGKGVVTASLVSKAFNPLVIRFNGGHQAGHTVVKDGFRHVFSSFGSGTLHGAPTYWSEFCTVYPTALVNEFHDLERFDPLLYIDPLCPITTPYDVWSNQKNAHHGSVGVGFGETIRRQENYFTLYAKDLKHYSVLKLKLEQIKYYYKSTQHVDEFMEDIQQMLSLKSIQIKRQVTAYPFYHGDLIFEGAQGILLDQRFGFFPHVTRSNTTSQNALTMLPKIPTKVYMVTRAYQTRHGNGPMTNENKSLTLINNNEETNVSHPFQGNFRTAPLDADLLRYAIECEESIEQFDKTIVMTCCDQVEEIPTPDLKYPVLYNFSPEGNFKHEDVRNLVH